MSDAHVPDVIEEIPAMEEENCEAFYEPMVSCWEGGGGATAAGALSHSTLVIFLPQQRIIPEQPTEQIYEVMSPVAPQSASLAAPHNDVSHA